jgi:pre-mRNA-processing factor 19
MLQGFQAEWDAVMLEVFTLKQQLTASQQELSHALYQQDAACRVIARLVKERDQYKRELGASRSSGAASASGNGMDVDVDGSDESSVLPKAIVQRISAKTAELSSARESRKIGPSVATRDQVSTYQAVSSHNNHKASPAAVKCVDVMPAQDWIVSGGADKTVVVFDRASNKKLHTLVSHTKAVTALKCLDALALIVSSSEDGTIRSFNIGNGDIDQAEPIEVLSGGISCMDVHPIGDLVVVGSGSGDFAMVDITSRKVFPSPQARKKSPITSIQFHPDGEIFGIGSEAGVIQILNVSTFKQLAVFEGHTGSISGICFSENGYSLASISSDQTLRIWDLQDVGTSKTVQLDSAPHAIAYDHSGRFLAVGCGKEIRVFTGRNVDLVASFDAHSKEVTGIRWGPDAKWFASVSLDRSLKVWSPQ